MLHHRFLVNKRESGHSLFILMNRLKNLLKIGFLWYNYVDKTNLYKGDKYGTTGHYPFGVYNLGTTIET